MELLISRNSIELHFQRCGETFISHDHKIFALNCCFCDAIFQQLEPFGKHILDVHKLELKNRQENDGANGDEVLVTAIPKCTNDDSLMANQSFGETEFFLDEDITGTFNVPLTTTHEFQDIEWEEEYLIDNSFQVDLQKDNVKLSTSYESAVKEFDEKNTVVEAKKDNVKQNTPADGCLVDNFKKPIKSCMEKKVNINSKQVSQEQLETFRLIETYKKFPILWNPNSVDGRSFKRKREAYESISNILTNEFLIPTNFNTVRQKIKNLRQQYKDYLEKLKKGIESRLWYLPLLNDFLKDNINTSMRISLIDTTNEKPIKEPKSLNLPFRYKQNLHLNVDFIEILRKCPKMWQNEDFTFKISTNLIETKEFQFIRNELNVRHALKLDDNNMLMLLHDLCEWVKRERDRKDFLKAKNGNEDSKFVSSSPECWQKIQFLAKYSFQRNQYTCGTCLKSTKHIHRYLIDISHHLLQQPHKCYYCDKRFVDVTNCRIHECRKHSKIYNHTCEFCQKKFAHATDALIHKRRFHTLDRPFVCEFCGKNFVTSYDMKRHSKCHSTDEIFKCKKCNAYFYMRKSLQHHMKQHTVDKSCNGYRKYECSFCYKRFVRYLSLESHLKLMHYEEVFSKNNIEKMQLEAKTEQSLEQFVHVSQIGGKHSVGSPNP